jgi:hypothetical protein
LFAPASHATRPASIPALSELEPADIETAGAAVDESEGAALPALQPETAINKLAERSLAYMLPPVVDAVCPVRRGCYFAEIDKTVKTAALT